MQDSIWFRTVSEDHRQLLNCSDPFPNSSEVAIIGAGMIGLATAYYLLQQGVRDICVLDRGPALGEASGANAGGLWFAQQSAELGPLAELAAASSSLYDELAHEFAFDLERCGLLELLPDEEAQAGLRERLQTTRQAGFSVEKIAGSEIRSLEPGLGTVPEAALFYHDEAKLNPVKLGVAWIDYLRRSGVRFCLNTEAKRLAAAIETTHGKLAAQTIVLASGAWTPQVAASLGWAPPIKPMRGTLLAIGPLPKTLHHTIVARRYYYWQMAEGYVAGGGSVDDVGFEPGVDPATVAHIREEMEGLIPAIAGQPNTCVWSGFRPYSEDLKPVIGPVPGQENLFVAAGHFKKGIMLAPITGKIVADLISAGQTQWNIDPLNPARFRSARS